MAVLTSRSAPCQSDTLSPLATASPPVATISSTTCWAGDVSPPVPSVFAAEIVDDDLGAVAGEAQRVLAADAPARSGDDGDSTFTETTHVYRPRFSECGGDSSEEVRLRARSEIGPFP